MTEKVCPYCKGTGVQMLATRVSRPGDTGTIEERHLVRPLIEPVHCWKCKGTGRVVE